MQLACALSAFVQNLNPAVGIRGPETADESGWPSSPIAASVVARPHQLNPDGVHLVASIPVIVAVWLPPRGRWDRGKTQRAVWTRSDQAETRLLLCPGHFSCCPRRVCCHHRSCCC